MSAPGRRLLRRPERERSILAAAARAFARGGFAATSMEDVAAEAGVTKLILYRHFDSKQDLYQAVLDRVRSRLREATGGADGLGPASLGGLLAAAREDPDGFLLLFRHAAREPRFADYSRQFTERAVAVAARVLEPQLPDPLLRQWTARLVAATAVEAIIAWLQAGDPARDGEMLARLGPMLAAIVEAAAPPAG